MSSVADNVRFRFLYADTYSFGKNWTFPESKIPYHMLRYIESGAGTFFMDGEETLVHKDQIVYIPRGCRLSCHATEEPFSFISIRFTAPVHFEGEDFLKDRYGFCNVMECEEAKPCFEKIYAWVRQENPAKMYFVRGYLDILIGTLAVRMNAQGRREGASLGEGEECCLAKIRQCIQNGSPEIDARIQGVLDYVVLHPAERYTPQRMAEMAELSRQRFGSLFKAQVGKSPMAYIKELKLTAAARRLLVCNKTVSEIAYEAGYEDPNYFIREFKAAFGYTPNQYRQAARE